MTSTAITMKRADPPVLGVVSVVIVSCLLFRGCLREHAAERQPRDERRGHSGDDECHLEWAEAEQTGCGALDSAPERRRLGDALVAPPGHPKRSAGAGDRQAAATATAWAPRAAGLPTSS